VAYLRGYIAVLAIGYSKLKEILFCSKVNAAIPYFKEWISDNGNNMWEYGNGTVLNVGGNSNANCFARTTLLRLGRWIACFQPSLAYSNRRPSYSCLSAICLLY